MTELQYIDRNKRLTVRLIEIVFASLSFFFLGCIYRKYDSTIYEDLLGFEEYWRTIGWIGLPISFLMYLFTQKILPFRNGKVILADDKIELLTKTSKSTFQISNIDNMIVSVDVPYEGDERLNSQKASRLRFSSFSRKYDLEVSTRTKDELDNFGNYVNNWKGKIKEFKKEYQ